MASGGGRRSNNASKRYFPAAIDAHTLCQPVNRIRAMKRMIHLEGVRRPKNVGSALVEVGKGAFDKNGSLIKPVGLDHINDACGIHHPLQIPGRWVGGPG